LHPTRQISARLKAEHSRNGVGILTQRYGKTNLLPIGHLDLLAEGAIGDGGEATLSLDL
jgi:hypothetical protein